MRGTEFKQEEKDEHGMHHSYLAKHAKNWAALDVKTTDIGILEHETKCYIVVLEVHSTEYGMDRRILDCDIQEHKAEHKMEVWAKNNRLYDAIKECFEEASDSE